MDGMTLSKEYFETYGRSMIMERFPVLANRAACGLAGEGSECFGFDDELSRDHDFGPGFVIWLTDEDFAEHGERLEAAYRELPTVFQGYKKRPVESFGDKRLGVMRISDFYRRFIGLDDAPSGEALDIWRRIPETYLATATNGEVFADPLGEFSRIRVSLLAYYPEDIRLKKLAARAAVMAQSGQYNYARALGRGDTAAMLLALAEFVKAACSAVYLLGKRYMPYYKWAHRGMREFDKPSGIYELIAKVCVSGDTERIPAAIENLCAAIKGELAAQGIINPSESNFLQDYLGDIMGHIENDEIRSLHVLAE